MKYFLRFSSADSLPKGTAIIAALTRWSLRRNHAAKWAVSILGAILIFPAAGLADDLLLWTRASDADQQVERDQDSVTDLSLTDETSGLYEASTQLVRYGSANVAGNCSVPGSDEAYFGASLAPIARWTKQLTINCSNPDQSGGTAYITMHFSGSFYATGTGDGVGQSQFGIYIYQDVGYNTLATFSGLLNSQTGLAGQDPAQIGAFTIAVPFSSGTPTTLGFSLNADSGVSNSTTGGATAGYDLSLREGSFAVVDDQNQTLDYTAESLAGSARGSNIPEGGSYNGFSLTNNAPGRMGTTFALLDGTASAPTNVNAAFVAPPPATEIKAVSDAVDLNGTNTDPVVIQINYDANIATSDFGSLAYLELAWFHNSTGTWKNAILGNTGTTMPTYFNRAYNPATDFHLGYFGNDTTNHVVWAVVNHNSEYVATLPPPALSVTSVTHPAAHTFHLNCQGEPARVNRVEASPDPDSAHFITVASITADGSGNFQFDDANAGNRRFYRVAYP